MNTHTSLSELWKKIRIAHGRTQRSIPICQNPKEEANKLIHNYQERASSDQLPAHTREKFLEMQPRKLFNIHRACNTQTQTDILVNRSHRDATERLTSDRSKIPDWGRENLVVFNTSKT
ncbi:hypothetical protein E2C01_057410 [Portunus trituberculatus]|uniref:Uncharacterized protein n=1 Tax=Portunus trituberculatus TaxID=210409 RepID=A0A5B7GZX2_PORTR|nr:hypothetical protein [Portunus trituberculatus]